MTHDSDPLIGQAQVPAEELSALLRAVLPDAPDVVTERTANHCSSPGARCTNQGVR